jgi:hypothetical protein
MLRVQLKRNIPILRARLGRILNPRMYDWGGIQVAFIVSTGRTGTRKLASFFSAACDRVDARHEPFPDMFDTGVSLVRSRLSREEAAKRFQRGRAYVCGQVHSSGCDWYIESNNNLVPLLPILRRSFKNCKIVHVVRDGRDFVRSAFSKTVPSATRRGSKALVLSEEDPRSRLQAPDFPDDPYAEKWARMSRFERLCWLWVKLNALICDAIRDDPRATTVTFEELFRPEAAHKGLWRVIEFLGLQERMLIPQRRVPELMAVKENPTQKYLIPAWTEWSPEQTRQFREIAGEAMAAFGYDA